MKKVREKEQDKAPCCFTCFRYRKAGPGYSWGRCSVNDEEYVVREVYLCWMHPDIEAYIRKIALNTMEEVFLKTLEEDKKK